MLHEAAHRPGRGITEGANGVALDLAGRGAQQFEIAIAALEEPASHLDSRFVSSHRFQADQSCAECHGDIAADHEQGIHAMSSLSSIETKNMRSGSLRWAMEKIAMRGFPAGV